MSKEKFLTSLLFTRENHSLQKRTAVITKENRGHRVSMGHVATGFAVGAVDWRCRLALSIVAPTLPVPIVVAETSPESKVGSRGHQVSL
jgi:hypothetical protein